jgi:transcriptional regulator GlxA family with amidase domain
VPKESKVFAFVLYPGVTPLDFVGPLTVLRDIGAPYEVVVVGERTEATPTDTSLGLIPAKSFDELPAPFGLIVPGAGAATVAAMHAESLQGYVRSAAAKAEVVGSSGSGALVLAAAGLLDGRRAAVHWAYSEQLRSLGVTPVSERWTEDGKFLTAAGGSAGIDMMLALLGRLKGQASAKWAQLVIEYDPQPPFDNLDSNTARREVAEVLASASSGARSRSSGPPGKTIAVVLYEGLTALDLIGPLQVLKVFEAFAPEYRTVVVGEQTEPMKTDVPVRLIPDTTFGEVPHPYVVVIPGGKGATLRAMSNPTIRQYVRSAASSSVVTASVCTGSLILASLGLLEGRQATTNWAWYHVLESFGAKYLRRRWVENEKFIMSAGVSAGIDMALYLVSKLADQATAQRVQLAIDYDPLPPFGGIDWEHLGLRPRAVQSAIGLAAPVITARSKRLTKADRLRN